MRFAVRIAAGTDLHWLFIDRWKYTRYLSCDKYYSWLTSPSPGKPIRETLPIKEQRERSLERPPANQLSIVSPQVPAQVKEFRPFSLSGLSQCDILNQQGFPLGPTNSRTNSAHSKPLSTSVVAIHIRLIATNTKICTSRGSSPVYTEAFDATTTPSYTTCLSPCRSGIGHLLQRHPFSGLVHSAGELLHTP